MYKYLNIIEGVRKNVDTCLHIDPLFLGMLHINIEIKEKKCFHKFAALMITK